ncbi:DUF6009 family protein [Streptomyces sp. NPDC050315]|uniref:DUF6009 family protein n=1 Tax=Streptomyces sp. NPDC050315 TaxID=3155039 RepID=UPI00342D5EA5
MSALIDPADLTHETGIVWLEDPDRLDYVRQSLDRVPGRTHRPPYHRSGRMIGYAVLGPDAKPSRFSGTHLRRVFWLAPHDRDQQPTGLYNTGAPSEAIDPRSVHPGVKGCKTERSEGGPLSAVTREIRISPPKS